MQVPTNARIEVEFKGFNDSVGSTNVVHDFEPYYVLSLLVDNDGAGNIKVILDNRDADTMAVNSGETWTFSPTFEINSIHHILPIRKVTFNLTSGASATVKGNAVLFKWVQKNEPEPK